MNNISPVSDLYSSTEYIYSADIAPKDTPGKGVGEETPELFNASLFPLRQPVDIAMSTHVSKYSPGTALWVY